nr:hypothetical protein GCM10010200_022960 [Actinomadura rugatobispora]
MSSHSAPPPSATSTPNPSSIAAKTDSFTMADRDDDRPGSAARSASPSRDGSLIYAPAPFVDSTGQVIILADPAGASFTGLRPEPPGS